MAADNQTFTSVERMLGLADEYQQRVDRLARRVTLVRSATVAVATILAILVAYAVWGIKTEWGSQFWLGILVVCGVTVAGALLVETVIIRALMRQRSRDERSLYEIVGLLREVGDLAAIESDWDALEIAEYRIRLARFEVQSADRVRGRRNL